MKYVVFEITNKTLITGSAVFDNLADARAWARENGWHRIVSLKNGKYHADHKLR